MKIYKPVFLLLSALCLVACGGDDDENEPTSAGTNLNRNSTSAYSLAGRMEFPHLASGNSVVLIHKTNDRVDPDGVNYAVEWDIDKKSQRWTCYQMTKSNGVSKVSRYYGSPQYPLDPDLPTGYYLDRPNSDYSVSDYYRGSDFDHGHICPSADRLYSKDANYQTFFLTNMQPQYSKFNGSDDNYKGLSLWLAMENQVRDWVPTNNTDTMYVCKGGTIGDVNLNGTKSSGVLMRIQQKLIVPKYFFAAILYKNSSGYRALAFWFEHTNNDVPSGARLSDYVISIDELEERTGIDFFCNLPDDIEKKVEDSVALKVWGTMRY